MELPTFENIKPTLSINSFYADSTHENEQLMYLLQWKTTYAKEVSITFIGKVDNSGSLLLTEKEYKYGPITLTATDENNQSISKTINGGQSVSPIMNSGSNKNSNYRAPIPTRHYPYRRPIHRRYY